MEDNASNRPVVALVGAELEENLSLRYLAGSLEAAGFQAVIVALREEGEYERLVQEVLASRAILVGISVPFQLRAGELLGTATALRARGYTGHITCGGHFATFEFTNLLNRFGAIDSVVRHEGEATLVALANLVRDESPVPAMPGLVLREQGTVVVGDKRPLPPLDSLPFPVRDGAPHDILGVACAPLVGSRGCYADCSFCCIYAYAENAQGARYRMRSVENIVAEMRAEYHGRGVRLFVFHDDNFFVPYLPTNKKRYQRMAELLHEEGMDDIGLVIKCRPNDVDEELFSLLKHMGMIRAYVGIETNSDEGIVSLNRRITSDDNRRALSVLKKLGVYHSFNVLLFDPEATLQGISRNLDFMEEFADSPFNFCRAEVYAGTPLKKILELENRLTGDYLAWGYSMREPRVELLFRIASTAFAARNFKHDGTANLNMGLRFDGEVFRRFYPSVWSAELQEKIRALSERIGNDTVANLRRALDFVTTCDLTSSRAVNDFTLTLARAVSRADLAFTVETKALRREMESLVRTVGGPSGDKRYAATMRPWAAESQRLGNSIGLELSSEILPAPSVVEVGHGN